MITLLRSISNRGLFILAIATLAGLPLTALGALQLWRTQQEISTGIHTKGVVLSSQEIQGAYYPIVRFEAQGQGIMRFTDRSGSYQAGFSDGQEVVVFYPQYEPEKARIFTPQRIWFAPLVMTSAGILPLLIGVIAVWFTERKKPATFD